MCNILRSPYHCLTAFKNELLLIFANISTKHCIFIYFFHIFVRETMYLNSRPEPVLQLFIFISLNSIIVILISKILLTLYFFLMCSNAQMCTQITRMYIHE